MAKFTDNGVEFSFKYVNDKDSLKKAENEAKTSAKTIENTINGISNRDFAKALVSNYNRAYKLGIKAAKNFKKEHDKIMSESQKTQVAGDFLESAKRAFQEAGATERQAFEGAVRSTEKFRAGLDSVTNETSTLKKMLGGVGTVAKKSFLGLGSVGLKALGGLKNLVGKGLSRAFGSLKRSADTAGMGLKRLAMAGLGFASVYAGIRKAIAFAREGFGNLSQASGETKRNVQSFSASLQYLKNALGACIAPIYNVVAPALSSFIDMLASAVNAFGKFISALTGRSVAVVAKKTFAGISDGASGAGSAMGDASDKAKELKRQLMGFDQIEKLDEIAEDLSSAGSGGGGGAGGSAFDDMFETVDTGETANKWADLVKEAWKKADFSEIGSIVGQKFKDALDKMPWDGIKATASKIGKSVATFINGAVETKGLGDSIGKSIAEVYNTAFTLAYNAVTALHWDSIGKFIGSAINGFLDNVDWNTIKKTATSLGSGLATALNNAISTTKFDSAGTSLGNAINTIINAGYSFATKFDFKKFGNSIGTSISSAVKTINWAKAGVTAGEWVKGLLDILIGTLEKTDWKALGEGVATFIVNIDWSGIISKAFQGIGALEGAFAGFIAGLASGFKKKFGEYFTKNFLDGEGKLTWESFLNGITQAGKDISNWIKKNIWEPYAKGFKNAFGIDKLQNSDMWKWGTKIVDSLFGGLSEAWKKVTGFFSDAAAVAKAFIEHPIEASIYIKDNGWEKFLTDYVGLKDKKVTATANGKETESFKTTHSDVDSLKGEKFANVTATGQQDSTFTAVNKVYNAVKNKTAEVKATGKEDETFTALKKSYTDKALGNTTATKTIAGKTDKSFTSANTAYTKLANGKAEKTILGNVDQSFTDTKTEYGTLVKGNAVKTIKGVTDKTYTETKGVFDAFVNGTATKTIAGNKDATFDDIKSQYNASDFKNKNVVAKISNQFPDRKAWDANLATFNSPKDRSVTAKFANQFSDKKAWDSNLGTYNAPKNRDVVAKISSKFADKKAWDSNASGYNALKSKDATAKLDNKWNNWEKWKERRDAYNAVKNRTATLTQDSKWYKYQNYKDRKKEYDSIASKTATVTAKFTTSGYATAKEQYNAMKNKTVTVTTKYSGATATRAAKGGALYGGKWHSIPQYASGGFPKLGSVFIAGEQRGNPELVSHIGNRTEVLNKSQIGAVIASGIGTLLPELRFIRRAQEQLSNGRTSASESKVVGLLVQIISAINNIDTNCYWDGNKVTNEIVKQINRNTQATGVCEIMI